MSGQRPFPHYVYISDKQKYDRVGQEIGTSMHKNLEEREKQIMKEQDEMEKLEVNDLEMERLQTAKENA